MKALTLHQPWATAIALGIKTVETRSWRTSYRGPLAIHAGTRRPPMQHIPPLWPKGVSREAAEASNRETFLIIDTITDPAYQRPLRSNPPERVPLRAKTPTLMFPHHGPHRRVRPSDVGDYEVSECVYLPLGVIVATCRLVDVVPITPIDGPTVGVQLDMIPGKVVKDRLLLWKSPLDPVDMTDQLPWGDFTPGRWAWLLDDVKPTTERCPACWGQAPEQARRMSQLRTRLICATCDGEGRCDPVPARGRQGLWNWEP